MHWDRLATHSNLSVYEGDRRRGGSSEPFLAPARFPPPWTFTLALLFTPFIVRYINFLGYFVLPLAPSSPDKGNVVTNRSIASWGDDLPALRRVLLLNSLHSFPPLVLLFNPDFSEADTAAFFFENVPPRPTTTTSAIWSIGGIGIQGEPSSVAPEVRPESAPAFT